MGRKKNKIIAMLPQGDTVEFNFQPFAYESGGTMTFKGDENSITYALVNNLASKRDKTLFDDVVGKTSLQKREFLKQMQEIDQEYNNPRNYKRVYFTPYQSKLVLALGQLLSVYSTDDDYRQAVTALKDDGHTTVTRRVFVVELVKKMYPKEGLKRELANRIISEIERIDRTPQIITFGEGNKWVRHRSIITIKDKLINSDPQDNDVRADFFVLEFSGVFFDRFFTGRVPLTDELFNCLCSRKYKTENEVAGVLFNELLRVFNDHRQKATKIAERRGQYDEATYKAQLKKALTYEIKVSTLLEKCATRFEGTKNDRAMMKKLEKHVINALNAYQTAGKLIAEFSTMKDFTKNSKIKVVFNYNYGRDAVIETHAEDMTNPTLLLN